jgi:hypothetical protein
VVCTLVPSNHTRSPGLNLYVALEVFVLLITSAATVNAAVTSDLIWSRVQRHSSTVGILVVKCTGEINSSLKPYQILKRDFPVVLCCRALCANSMKGISSTQLSCWKLPKTRRYCSSSWLTLSVSTSVWGWKAVDMVDLTPSLFHTSCMTLDANWLSDMTWWGSLVCLQTLSMYNLEVSSAVIVLVHGDIIVVLLRQSTTTNNESYPWELGRSVIKSTMMTPHMSVGIWLGTNSTWFLGLILVA